MSLFLIYYDNKTILYIDLDINKLGFDAIIYYIKRIFVEDYFKRF